MTHLTSFTRRGTFSATFLWSTIAILLLGSWVSLPARGQEDPEPATSQPDDKPKVDDLKPRFMTVHYAVAGTPKVKDADVERAARLLESIHREYLRCFAKVDGIEEPADRVKPPTRIGAKRPAGRTNRKSSPKNADPKETAEVDVGNRYRAYVFVSEAEYNSYCGQYMDEKPEFKEAAYIPKIKAVFLRPVKERYIYEGRLHHAAFHQFMHTYMIDPPPWLNEGLAIFFETAQPTATGVSWTMTMTEWWQEMYRITTGHGVIPLDEVVHAATKEFYDKHARAFASTKGGRNSRWYIYMGESYTLVDLLLSDREGSQRLREYIRDLARDKAGGAKAITNKYFDKKTCDLLRPAWEARVKTKGRVR